VILSPRLIDGEHVGEGEERDVKDVPLAKHLIGAGLAMLAPEPKDDKKQDKKK